MKKKYKLKGWVKVVLTIILLFVSLSIYLRIGELGQLAQTSIGYLLICIGAWFWLLTGQMIVIVALWGDYYGD